MKISNLCPTSRGRLQPTGSRNLVQVVGAIGVALASCYLTQPQASATTSNATRRPNIVLMMADDLGWGDTGYNGHPHLKTPHLDAMASAGLRFNRFYAGAPVCSPTRGSCLTGRHPYRYGIFFANTGHMLVPELTLAEILQEQGYATGHFGKWHLGTLTKTEKDANRGGPQGAEHFAPPAEHGFQEFFSTESKVPTWDPLLRPSGNNSRTWWDPIAADGGSVPYGTAYWHNGRRVTDALRGDDSRVIMDRALPFIRRAAEKQQPFFTVIWFHAPHLPVVAGPKYTAAYAKFPKFHQHYYGCITAMDEQVGRLRAALRQLQVADNTLVFFCSDNGPEGNDKAPGSAGILKGRKRSLDEGGVRVPGLAEWPAVIKAGTTTEAPASTSDYLPTVLELLGIGESVDGGVLDGVSLLPLLAGKTNTRTKPIAFESRSRISLVGNRFKLIQRAAEGKSSKKNAGLKQPKSERQFALYDLQNDPSETKDISAAHPEVVAKMRATLLAWRESCRASLQGDDYRAP